jgi:hypothetical protein
MVRDASFQGRLYRKDEVVTGLIAAHFILKGIAR